MKHAKHYVPILRVKGGEIKALQETSMGVKSHMTPLFDMPDVDTEDSEVDDLLAKILTGISKSWGNSGIAFVDLGDISSTASTSTGLHPVEYLFGQARMLGLSLIPVSGPGRDAAFQKAVKAVMATDSRGVCIRIEDALEDDSDIAQDVLSTMAALGTSANDVDLVIDCGYIRHSAAIQARLADTIVRALPSIGAWRTLTLAGTAFPETMAGFPPRQVSITPRVEWQAWLRLYRAGSLPRMPAFGDYTVTNPSLIDFDPVTMSMGAKIKYTTDADWLLVKGQGVKRHGYVQFRHLSAHLISLKEYCGPNFSWGDHYIEDCANSLVGTGSQATWVSVGVNHHLAFVVDQIMKT